MGYGSTAGYIYSIYLESVCRIRLLSAVMRGLIAEEILKVFSNKCSMRNAICPAPCWSNKSIIPITPSDDGPYLTAVWMVLLSPDGGRPYFTIGAVIT